MKRTVVTLLLVFAFGAESGSAQKAVAPSFAQLAKGGNHDCTHNVLFAEGTNGPAGSIVPALAEIARTGHPEYRNEVQ